jgi:DNA-binding MarR family transcriptional regulator
MLSEILPAGRWKLLRALWLNGARGSVQGLARQTGLSYSNAHAELKRLERAGLARSWFLGNALVFTADKRHRVAAAIEAFVRASDESRPAEDDDQPLQVMANLASLGAPVQAETTPARDLVPEEVVARGLRWTHFYPTLARAYPVLVARNRNRLNLERLKQRATEL